MFVKPGEVIVQRHSPMVIMLEGDGPLEALVEKAKSAPPMGARPRRTYGELEKLPTRPVCPRGHTSVDPRIVEYDKEEWYCRECRKGFNEPGVQIIAPADAEKPAPPIPFAHVGPRERRPFNELDDIPAHLRPTCPEGHPTELVTPRADFDKAHEWYCRECASVPVPPGMKLERGGFNEPGVKILAVVERVRRPYSELNRINAAERPNCPKLHSPDLVMPRSDDDHCHEWYCCKCSTDYYKNTGFYYEGFNEPGVKIIHPEEAKRRRMV